MIRRLHENLLVRPEDMAASRDDFEVIGAFNPGAIEADNQVVLLVRVAERPRERRPGFHALPRWDVERQETAIEWLSDDELEVIDPRVVRVRATGRMRLTFLSHLRVLRSHDGRTVGDFSGPLFGPASETEEFGVEDPRITRIADRYWITYVAVSRHGAATALASTTDFVAFERHGIIFPVENKDVVLFPELIDGHYLALHRPNGATPFTTPEMWIAYSPDLIHWGGHQPLATGESAWETGRIGAGTPPIRTPAGWLEIYHGSQRSSPGRKVGVYTAAAMLLDAERPHHILARSAEAILVPQAEYERRGFVPDVVFPTGIVQRGDRLLLYYGAADTYSAMVELSLDEVLASLEAPRVGMPGADHRG
jgi:beta-1,2-mannobiose phosphorylase / 1,2-beta-oligomannan phosphorylase